jgi:adenosylhomocysteine nucleosidase
VAETGVGGQAAAKAADDILAFHAPRWLISAGFAGGLADEIRPGHLVLADKIGNTGGETLSIGLPCDREWIAQARGVHAGKLLTVDEIVRTEAEKRSSAERHGAIACDMESFAIAEVCRDRRTPLLSIRIVTDAVDDTLPAEIDRLMRQTSLAGKLGAAAGAVFKRPSAAKELWDLRGTALKASDRLAKFLVSMLAQLPVAGD